MPTVDNDGTAVYYEVHGDGLAHRLRARLRRAPRRLVAAGRRAARPVHRRHPRPARLRQLRLVDAEYDSQNFPGDIVAVIEDADLTDAVLLGQSIGAAAALKAALRVPDRIRGVDPRPLARRHRRTRR